VIGQRCYCSTFRKFWRGVGLEYALCAFASEDLDDLLRLARLFAERVAPQFADAG
jgi:hypothetical protein